jgi:NADPH:quinone reductase-like Zn-dependent oxidoreductase
MLAWTLPQFGIDQLRLVEQPEGALGEDEVRVQIKSVSLNYRDLLIVQGKYHPRLKLPCVIGSDASGVVTECGNRVSRVTTGQRVVLTFATKWHSGPITDEARQSARGAEVSGVFAQQVICHEQSLVPLPDTLSFEEAATLPCAAVTASMALQNLLPSERILIQGTGGVSLFALQYARRKEGSHIFVISSDDTKLAKAKELGADEIWNYRKKPDWEKWIREKTDQIGVDRIIEVGGPATLDRSLKAIRSGGEIALIGVLAGEGHFNPMPIIMKGITLRGIFVGPRSELESVVDSYSYYPDRPIIDRIFSMDQLPEALHYLETGKHIGKIVLNWDR